MDFGTAIKTCFKKFGTFEGRAGKAEFWYFYLLGMGLNVVSYFIDVNYFGIREGFGPASTIVGLVFALPGLAVASRRLHDIGKSGWWQLIALTGIGLIPLLFWWTSDPVRGSRKTRRRSPVEDYDESVQQVRLFMRGRHHELLEQIKSRMKDASAKLEFEKAAMLRDQARALGRIFEKQTVLDAKGNDQDVFNLFRESNSAGIQVLFIRNGRLLGTDFFFYEECEQVTDDNLLGQVLNRIYMNDKAVMPREILLPFEYSDQQELEKVLNEKSERKVTVQRPQRGRKKELVQMAFNNAKMNLGEQRARTLRDDEVLRRVQGALHLNHLPLTVEAFDISHLSGNQTVASMVSWKRNHASRQDYRKYRIQSIEGPDDFASMKEVLTRRYKRTLSGEMPLPNLILIDGGKGQVNVAHQVLQDLDIPLERIDLIGLAKGRSERRRVGGGSRLKDFEYIVKPNMKNEIRPHRNSPELYFLQNIRDESHRFAIQFQRQLKRSENMHSVLEDIPGVGRERRRLLLRQFGSLTSLKKAQIEDLLRVPGISRKLAGEIHSFFSTNN